MEGCLLNPGHFVKVPPRVKTAQGKKIGGRPNHFGATSVTATTHGRSRWGGALVSYLFSRGSAEFILVKKSGFDPSAASFWLSNGFRPKALLLLLRERVFFSGILIAQRVFRGGSERVLCAPPPPPL